MSRSFPVAFPVLDTKYVSRTTPPAPTTDKAETVLKVTLGVDHGNGASRKMQASGEEADVYTKSDGSPLPVPADMTLDIMNCAINRYMEAKDLSRKGSSAWRIGKGPLRLDDDHQVQREFKYEASSNQWELCVAVGCGGQARGGDEGATDKIRSHLKLKWAEEGYDPEGQRALFEYHVRFIAKSDSRKAETLKVVDQPNAGVMWPSNWPANSSGPTRPSTLKAPASSLSSSVSSSSSSSSSAVGAPQAPALPAQQQHQEPAFSSPPAAKALSFSSEGPVHTTALNGEEKAAVAWVSQVLFGAMSGQSGADVTLAWKELVGHKNQAMVDMAVMLKAEHDNTSSSSTGSATVQTEKILNVMIQLSTP